MLPFHHTVPIPITGTNWRLYCGFVYLINHLVDCLASRTKIPLQTRRPCWVTKLHVLFKILFEMCELSIHSRASDWRALGDRKRMYPVVLGGVIAGRNAPFPTPPPISSTCLRSGRLKWAGSGRRRVVHFREFETNSAKSKSGQPGNDAGRFPGYIGVSS